MTSRLALAVPLGLALLTTASAASSTTNYNATLTGLTASTRADGTGAVFSMTASGDLKGLVTVDLDPNGGTGTWTLQASYVQDFYADGTPALTPPASEEEEAANPTTPRQMNDGSLTGTVTNATIGVDGAGRKILTFAQLTVTGGSAKFAGAQGIGTLVATQLADGTFATSLSLTF